MMEGKLRKEELFKVITQLQIVERLPKQSLQELCKVFKVEDPTSDLVSLHKQFKNKMIDIFIQQGDGYMDYLQLPKFKLLGPDMTEKMFGLFRTAWEEYELFKKREQMNLAKKQIDQLAPTFESLDALQHFHLSLLDLYRDSSLCPKNSNQYQKPIIEQKPPPIGNSNFLFSNSTGSNNAINQNISSQLPPAMYPYFSFPPPNSFPKVQPQDGMPYILDNKQQGHNMFDMGRYAMPTAPFYNPPQQFYPQEPKRRLEPKKQVQVTEDSTINVKNIFGQDLQNNMNRFSSYEFIQCVCQGKKGPQQKNYFQCQKCLYSYHLSCLRIQNNAGNPANCPLCILRKQTVFCKVLKQPLKYNWHLQENGKELKVQMTEDQSDQIHQGTKNGLHCQIRFLKIDGRSLKKQKKPLQGFTTFNGYLQKAPKHTQITLPTLSTDRSKPISLQIILRGQQQTQQQVRLYFFAVFLITTRKVDEVVTDLFSSQNYVGEQYYQQFFDSQGKVQVTLNNDNFSRGLIKYPVRGANCHHANVFDFKSYLDIVNDLKRDTDSDLTCPICSIPCPTFKFDQIIYRCILNLPDYDQKQPEAIQIQRGGQFAWVKQAQQPQNKQQVQQIDKSKNDNLYDNFMNQQSQQDDDDYQQQI